DLEAILSCVAGSGKDCVASAKLPFAEMVASDLEHSAARHSREDVGSAGALKRELGVFGARILDPHTLAGVLADVSEILLGVRRIHAQQEAVMSPPVDQNVVHEGGPGGQQCRVVSLPHGEPCDIVGSDLL